MLDNLRVSYDILSKIYKDKTFSTELLYKRLENNSNAPTIYRIVMGTLERDVELEYILSQVVNKAPKQAIKIILKQGIYCLKYMDNMPDYALIDNSVELTKTLGKGGVSGFVNAVLKKVARDEYPKPQDDNQVLSLSIKYSVPQWIIKMYINDFGLDTTIKIISAKPCELTHIRVNTLKYDDKTFVAFLNKNNIDFEKTECGYLLRVQDKIKQLFSEGKITYQSYTSIKAVDALDVVDGQDVLDICSAPGGKSVLIAERNKNGKVVSCDLHLHRVKLVGAYLKRMGIKNVTTHCLDATQYNSNFEGKFDRVLVDAPCSALGVSRKHPDIYLNREESSIKELAKTQFDILQNCAKYLKKGGVLVYSTCTLNKRENERVLDLFEKQNKNFVPDNICDLGVARKRFLPNNEIDGFFIAKYKKV